MFVVRAPAVLSLLLLAACASGPEPTGRVQLQSVAVRIWEPHTDRMIGFYRDAFGFEFHEVDTFGVKSYFGTLGGLTLKLVPIRESADFENFPSHQLGFEVDDLRAVIDLAQEYGGSQEGVLHQDRDRLAGAVRDPDGNTIELYEREPNSDASPYDEEPFVD